MKKILKKIAYFTKEQHVHDIATWEKFLKDEKVFAVDVGYTGGLEDRFQRVENLFHFYAFDPDERAKVVKREGVTFFPIGLWSKKCVQTLNLTKFAPASSLYEHHLCSYSKFLNDDGHQVIDKKSIHLDALQNILANDPPPEFIKVDAEGADLEILKGARKYIGSSVLGCNIEVSFYERYKKAALFTDIHKFMEKEYFLMDLSRSRWVRDNNRFGLLSFPQLIWGNATYMLKPAIFLKRLRGEKNRDTMFLKFILLLLLYRFHDYAEEIRLLAFGEELISSKVNSFAKRQIYRASKTSKFLFFKIGIVLFFAWIAKLIFKPFKSLSKASVDF